MTGTVRRLIEKIFKEYLFGSSISNISNSTVFYMMSLATVPTRMEDSFRIFFRNTCIQITLTVLLASIVIQIFLKCIGKINLCIIPVM